MNTHTQELLKKLMPEGLPWLSPVFATWQQQQAAGRMGHAYLFQAATGLGVEVLIREITRLRLCQSPRPQSSQGGVQACGQCSGCQLFAQNQHPDFYHLACLEEKKEISIAQIRALIDKQNQTAHQGGFKVIWIEEVEKLSTSAFNALLKSLEEPGANTLFLLTSNQAATLPATIRSRCQKVTVPQPSSAESLQWLAQQLPQQDEAMLKKALRLNWSAPIQAYEWVQSGCFNQEREWQQAIYELANGQKLFTHLAADWLKWDNPEQVFGYFYAWVLAKIRKLGYGLENLPAGEKPDAQAQMQKWLAFQNAVSLAHNDWRANANKELVFENLLLEWQGLVQQEQSGQLGRYDYQSQFQSNLNRGNF